MTKKEWEKQKGKQQKAEQARADAEADRKFRSQTWAGQQLRNQDELNRYNSAVAGRPAQIQSERAAVDKLNAEGQAAVEAGKKAWDEAEQLKVQQSKEAIAAHQSKQADYEQALSAYNTSHADWETRKRAVDERNAGIRGRNAAVQIRNTERANAFAEALSNGDFDTFFDSTTWETDTKALNRQVLNVLKETHGAELTELANKVKEGTLTSEEFNKELTKFAAGASLTRDNMRTAYVEGENDLAKSIYDNMKDTNKITIADFIKISNTQNVFASLGKIKTGELINAVLNNTPFDYTLDRAIKVGGQDYAKGSKISITAENMQEFSDALRATDTLDRTIPENEKKPGLNRFARRDLSNAIPIFEKEEAEEAFDEEELREPEALGEAPNEYVPQEYAGKFEPQEYEESAEPPAPDFSTVRRSLYSGAYIQDRVGQRGMGSSDLGINNQIIEHNRQAAAVSEASRKQFEQQQKQIEQQKMVTRLNNVQLDMNLAVNESLYNMQNLEPEKVQEKYNEFVQKFLTNPEWSPDATDDPQEKIARQEIMQKTLNDFQLKVQQVAYKNNTEKSQIETTNKVNALIEQTGRGEIPLEESVESLSAIFDQVNLDGRFSQAQKNELTQTAAANLYAAGISKKVGDIINEAAKTGQPIGAVNSMLGDFSDTVETIYAYVFDELGLGGKEGARANIFESAAMTAFAGAKKQLLDYNAGVHKTREAEFQNLVNNGFYNEARDLGKGYRTALDRAMKEGNVSEDFYFNSKDFFKPFVVAVDKSGDKTVKGLNTLFEQAVHDFYEYFDRNGQGRTPSQIEDSLIMAMKEMDEEGEYTESEIRNVVRTRLMNGVINETVPPDSSRAVYGGIPRLQQLLLTVDQFSDYLEGKKGSKEYKTLEKALDTNNNNKLDENELKEAATNANSIIWGALFDQVEHGMPAFGDEKSFQDFRSKLVDRAFSSFYNLWRASPLSDEVNEMLNGGVGKQGYRPEKVSDYIVSMLEGIKTIPSDYFSEQTGGMTGRATYEQSEDYYAMLTVLTNAMDNIDASSKYATGDLRTDSYFLTGEGNLAARSQDGKYEFEFQTGKTGGVFGTGVGAKDQVNVLVFPLDDDGRRMIGDRGYYVQEETIKDILSKKSNFFELYVDHERKKAYLFGGQDK